MAQLNKLSLWELCQPADGKTGALSITLCPLDPFTSPNMLLLGRRLQEPEEFCKCCWALHGAPTAPVASRVYGKGTQAKEALLENWEGGKGKENSDFLKKSWEKERSVTKVETYGFPVLINL